MKTVRWGAMNRVRLPLAALVLATLMLAGLATLASPAQADDAMGGWHVLRPQPTGFWLYGFAPVGATGLCAVGGFVGGTPPDTIALSTDDGVTWAAPTITPAPGESPFALRDVTFVDSNDGYAVGQDQAAGVATTTDGGATWTEQAVTPADGDGYLYSVSFVDSQTGWIAGEYGPTPAVYHTTDGGGSWAPESLPYGGQSQAATSVDFTDGSHGWLLTSAGWVFRTTDGGADWTLVAESFGGGKVYGQAWLDTQHGWLVGENGYVGSTTDGGATWTSRQIFPSYERLMGVAFGDTLHGWALGSDFVFATTDGGVTWHVQGVNGAVAEKIKALSPTHVYTWSTYGVAETTTGGQDPDDTTPPAVSFTKPAGTWFNHDVTVTIHASDQSGVFAVLGGVDGVDGAQSAVTVRASGGQGFHTATAIAVDNAGNGSTPITTSVGIDTRAPTKSDTLDHPTVRRGRTATFRYRISDPLPGCGKARAALYVVNAKGHVVRKISLGTVAENTSLSRSYRCTLARGRYFWFVRATDIAGNACPLKHTWYWTLTVK